MIPARLAVPFAMLAIVQVSASAPLPAQGVTVTATALNELQVQATRVTDSVPANFDMSAGLSLIADDPVFRAKASLTFTVEQDPSRILVKLTERGSAGSSFLTFGESGRGIVGPNRVRVEFKSPRPMAGKLIVRYCAQWSGAGRYSARIDVVGHGSIVTTASEPCFFGLNSRTFDVVVGESGLEVLLETEGRAVNHVRTGSGPFSGFIELELVPDQSFPCEIESYGDPCGATLTATTDLDHPGLVVITLEDPSLPPLAALGLGFERRSIPEYGCTLYHELLVLYPWSIDANGRAVVVFDPPRIPGFTFKVQAATLKGGRVHATNGLDFLMCRSGFVPRPLSSR